MKEILQDTNKAIKELNLFIDDKLDCEDINWHDIIFLLEMYRMRIIKLIEKDN